MSEPQSDAEKIRNKRLAKLGAGQSAFPSSSSTPKAPGSPSSPAPSASAPGHISASQAPSSPKPSASPSNPFEQLGIKSAPHQDGSAARPKINITPLKREVDGRHRQPPPQGKQEESIEEWEDHLLRGIFRVSLDASHTTDVQGHSLIFLPDFREAQEDRVGPAMLSAATLDAAIIEAGSNVPDQKVLDYLLGCWKRVVRQGKLLRNNPNTDPAKHDVIKETRWLVMSYSIFAITDPELFGLDAPLTSPLVEHLLADPDSDRGVCFDFVEEATSRMPDDESARDALTEALVECSHQLSKISMAGDYQPYMMTMRHLVRHRAIVEGLVAHEKFMRNDLAPQEIEKNSFLGPFFKLSPLQADVAKRDFLGTHGQPETMTRNVQHSLRLALATHQDALFDITSTILKTSKKTRDSVLDWFALVVNSNHKRRAMQPDPKTTASDGFMVNVTTILDRFCEPFMDSTFSKIHRVEVEYLCRSPRVVINDETKINADQNTSDEFYSHTLNGQSSFISEVFFLTLAAHHYGTDAANQQLSNKERAVKHLEKEIVRIEAERPNYQSSPNALARFEEAVAKYKDKLETTRCEIKATQGILLDETSQGRSMQLMRYVIVWLLRLVSPKDIPKQSPELPLPAAQPDVFRCLPEYFIEDIVENFKFITRHMPHVITSTQCEEIVTMCITFLLSSEYVKNPYLKSGLVTILYSGVWAIPNRPKGVLGDQLFGSPFALKHLLHALMKFFIEAESTGTHSQFYDKFNIRYEIFQVIRCIWPNSLYRDNLAEEARVNTEFFVRFVNLLLNDVTFVLGESFDAFKNIHELTEAVRSPDPSWTPEQKQEKEDALSSAKGKAKSYMQLTNETVSMLKLFTEALADSFTKAEIVQRLADMLDYNLDALTGRKQSELRVENKEEYNWRPQNMLADIMDVYINLRAKPNFILAVARDGRSYRPENFERAVKIMNRFALKSPEQLGQWEELARSIAAAKEEDDRAEEDLGDIPDEFLDPLMFSLMADPVTLPGSRVVMDRSTIRSHLLSDPTDPFNRQPLRIEDVVDNVEMRQRIEAFKAERRAAKERVVLGGAMDTN